MSNNQKNSLIFPFFIILIIFLLAFSFPTLENNFNFPVSTILFYGIILVVISPGLLFFIFQYPKMRKAEELKGKQIRYFNATSEVDFRESNLYSLLCPQCNFKNEAKDVYCGNCGYRL